MNLIQIDFGFSCYLHLIVPVKYFRGGIVLTNCVDYGTDNPTFEYI